MMKVRELIEKLQKADPELDVKLVCGAEDIITNLHDVYVSEEMAWLDDMNDKTGKSFQKTGRNIMILE